MSEAVLLSYREWYRDWMDEVMDERASDSYQDESDFDTSGWLRKFDEWLAEAKEAKSGTLPRTYFRDTKLTVRLSREKIAKIIDEIGEKIPVMGGKLVSADEYNEALELWGNARVGMKWSKVITKAYGDQKKFQRLFDYINMPTEINDMTLCLTAEPMAFLAMSNGHNWHSCHAPGGCYSGGAVSYSIDPCAMLVLGWNKRLTDEEKERFWEKPFDYRQVVLINDRRDEMVFSRIYPTSGDRSDELLLEIREWVESIIDPSVTWKSKSAETLSEDYVNSNNFIGYADWRYYEAVCVKKPHVNLFKVIEMTKDYPKCMSCGKRNMNEKSIVCEDCYEYSRIGGYECYECGCRLDEEDACRFGCEIYCDECYDRMFCECDCCGNTIDREYAVRDVDGDRYYCDRCVERNFSTCPSCGYRLIEDDFDTCPDCGRPLMEG